ncbi:WD40 repeat domain-containing protein [Longimicrobium sp.]|uniref:WD40 repeat domain-containing protein n=1 Tax=Longimicrobium sp. TaxID=2029185 RepID=UPI002CA3E27F|nr:WD40 repeat domain-containing protein [Longimicrobium sp.]HSU15638.1 WD40 repeat domain-containing protein [Longimicrobium sp.]
MKCSRALVVPPFLGVLWTSSVVGQQVQQFALAAPVNMVAYSRDGARIAAALEDGRLVLLDPSGGQVLKTIRPNQGAVNSVTFSPDNRILATGGEDGEVVLWDAATLVESRRLRGHQGAVYRITFSPDGRLLASGGQDKTVRIWDIATGTQRNNFTGHPGPVVSVAFSPDGRVLASSSLRASLRAGKTLILHDVASGRTLMELTPHKYRGFGRNETVYMASYSPDGKEFATASDNREIILWDNQVSDTLHLLEAHQKAVMALAFSPDGRLLASGGLDNRTLIWSTESGLLETELPIAQDWILSVSFSPDGRRLAASSKDGTVRVWDLSATLARLAHSVDEPDRGSGAVVSERSTGRTVLFILNPSNVSGDELWVNPFVVFERGNFISPLDGFIPKGGFNYQSGDSREASRRLLQTYFPSRESVAVVQGGVRIGAAVLNPVDYEGKDLFDGCFGGYGVTARGRFSVPPHARSFIGVRGARAFPEGRSARRIATISERTSFLRAARDVLQARGAPPTILRSLTVVTDAGDDVQVVDLDRDGSLELVGSVAVHSGGVQHNLFLIVKAGAGAVRPALVSYHRSEFPADGNRSHETERFVDHIDIDGDGADEIIVTKEQYEGMYYVIFKRNGTEWGIVYRGGGGGC